MARSLRVLVADDNPVNLRLAAAVLRDLGHGGALVPDGLKALQALERQPFDLLLLDVNMPQMDGLAVLRHLRAQEQAGGPKLPIIMVTAHDQPSDRRAMLAAGADGYVAKPLDVQRLQSELQRVLGPL